MMQYVYNDSKNAILHNENIFSYSEYIVDYTTCAELIYVTL